MAVEMEKRDLSPAGWDLCLEMLRLTGDDCTWGWGVTEVAVLRGGLFLSHGLSVTTKMTS